ncbi:TRAP transporter small permease [Aquibaculum sediminis]|uniref:TRAP transporter small permease n=1 Tax=Aquibaculum sediminis TaxID=3231907 RepID=UPI00345226C4
MPLLAAVRRVSDIVNTLAIWLCIACVLGMLCISFVGFLHIMITGRALTWTYSLARVLLPWIGLISGTIALRYGEHVAMTLLAQFLPRPLIRFTQVLCLVAIALFGFMLIWYGWPFFTGARQTYMVSDLIRIPQYYTAIAVPLSGAIILLHLSHGFALLGHDTSAQEAVSEAIGEKPSKQVT